MSIYNVDSEELMEAYDVDGEQLELAYDVDGELIFESGGSPGPEPEPEPEPSGDVSGRILVFEDDFLGNSLDTNKWGYEVGYCRNEEYQHYRPENVIVSNGSVNLKAIRGHYPGSVNKQTTWTSGSIHTQGRFSAMYGRWQARIKFPKIRGCFGAFWCLADGLEFKYFDDGTKCSGRGPATWAESGEIDINETIPGDVDKALFTIWNYAAPPNNPISAGQSGSSPINLSDWNIYEMEWTPKYIKAMVNGVVYHTYDLTNEGINHYSTPVLKTVNGFYMILNQAIGASGGVPAEGVNEMDMLVDWVRVYAPVGYTQDMINAKSISIPGSKRISVGDRVDLIVNWYPKKTFNRTVRWSSSNPSIATVNSGRVRGISPGTAIITCTTNNDKSAQCVVTVSG